MAIAPMPKSLRIATARNGTTAKKPMLKISGLASSNCGAGSTLAGRRVSFRRNFRAAVGLICCCRLGGRGT